MWSLYIVCHISWVEVELQSFWTSALDGGEWSASDPDHFTSVEGASIRLGGPQNLSERSGEEINLLPLLEFEPCTIHPVA